MVTVTQMNARKLLILTAILIGTTGLATASQAELTIFPEESSTRIDSFTSYELSIENVGPVEDTYALTSSSVEEIDIAPRKVNLKPGEEETLNVWYNPSQDREEGTYSFSVTAESRATNQRYSEEFLATVIRDHDVTAEVDQTSRTVCRGETATYTVEVTNDGIQQEEFQLSADYGELSQNRVTLEDGETKTVTLTTSSENDVTENFNLRVASTTSYSQDITNLRFNSETCYDSEVSVTPTKQRNAGGSTATFDITVRNLGTREDAFTLSANKGEFTENNVEVEGGESQTLRLDTEVEELGQRTINIRAEGRSSSSATATLQTDNGNNMQISFENRRVSVCETEQATVETVIENTGETDETYSLETNSGTLEQEEVEIEAGETETVETLVDATQLETGSYRVETTATATSYGEPAKSGTARVVVENCYDVSVNVVPQVASAGENRSVIYEINVENPGTVGNTYELQHEGPEWISIKPEELTVGPGQTETSYMYAGIPFKKQGNVQITATATGNNAEDSQTVELVIGQDIEEAIRDGENRLGNGITGQFSNALENLRTGGTLVQVVAAFVIALLITGVILIREW
jgi:uncharacterized membrane protein